MSIQKLSIILVFIFSLIPFACTTGETPTPRPSSIPLLSSTSEAPVSTFPPLVRQTIPEPGDEHDLEVPLRITFDQPMDKTSVEAAFTLMVVSTEEPVAVEGTFEWVDDVTVRFRPIRPLERGQRYEVTIATPATNIAGLPLNRPLELAFKTIGFLEVVNVQPEDGMTEIEPDATITVLFNQPVVPLLAIGG